jgi:putative tryptophan/tyrosine transport system substrate-binding protein
LIITHPQCLRRRGDQMKRREFITLLGSAAAAWPLAARAQHMSGHPLIGVVSPLSSASAAYNIEAFREGLRELGYVEGSNITIELRFAEGAIERLPDLVTELVALKLAVIVAGSPPAALAARNVTRTIPIVINSSENPVILGLAGSLARPGGNVTGFWFDDEGLTGKRFELLKEAVPGTARVGIIVNPDDATDNNILKSFPAVTRALDLTVRIFEVRTPTELESAFMTATREDLQGLQISLAPMFFSHRATLATLAANARLPAIYGMREFATVGGLMSYGASLPDIYRRLAGFVDKILKGTSSADLPIQRPTKFELVINLKTAKGMGLTIPESFLLRADALIE